MASTCISSCVDETRVPVRANYKWPESEFEFVRSMRSSSRNRPRVADCISCRQMYLRSYTFSTEEEEDNTKTSSCNCLARSRGDARRKNPKSGSCSYIFRRLLSCTTEINVAD